MKYIPGLLILCFAFAACSLEIEKPPTTVIDYAVRRYGGIAHYLENQYTLRVASYKETNYYRRKLDDEVWHVYDFDVSRELPTGSIGAFMPEKVEISIGFIKRGSSWYFRPM
ncbi:MAG: hypothetical protein ABSG50_00595 [Opitutaceae bacterium]|jgi:hypothetical protein